jgi:hypothetical protein
MNKTFLSVTLTCLVLLGFAACDAPTESKTLDLDLTCDPNPITAVESHGVTYTITNADDTVSRYEYPWLASFTINIKEQGGMSLQMTSVNVKVEQASGGIVITPSGGDVERYKFNFSASDNQLPSHGTMSVGFNTWYQLPNQGREANITASMSFKDEDEYVYSTSKMCRVAP